MKLGIVSDTHMPQRGIHLPAALISGLQGVDLILHAGDITQFFVLDELSRLAPVEAVAGNVDPPELRERLGSKKLVRADRFVIGLVHGDNPCGNALVGALHAFEDQDVDCVVFGHSHQAHCERHGEVLFLNPGSPTDKRRSPKPSYAILHVGDSLRGEIIYF
ncbi:MAG: metallophosphoesterase [Chloroflexota bacterium]|nr:MAG: metallophosphoesterase [Chloroflexota bacterium]